MFVLPDVARFRGIFRRIRKSKSALKDFSVVALACGGFSPVMVKASKNFRPVAITANDLRTGAVLYRAPDGAWVSEAARADIALDPSRAEALLAAAKADHDSGAVVEPFLIEFDPAKRVPLSLRERIRAAGPTIALPGA